MKSPICLGGSLEASQDHFLKFLTVLWNPWPHRWISVVSKGFDREISLWISVWFKPHVWFPLNVSRPNTLTTDDKRSFVTKQIIKNPTFQPWYWLMAMNSDAVWLSSWTIDFSTNSPFMSSRVFTGCGDKAVDVPKIHKLKTRIKAIKYDFLTNRPAVPPTLLEVDAGKFPPELPM